MWRGMWRMVHFGSNPYPGCNCGKYRLPCSDFLVGWYNLNVKKRQITWYELEASLANCKPIMEKLRVQAISGNTCTNTTSTTINNQEHNDHRYYHPNNSRSNSNCNNDNNDNHNNNNHNNNNNNKKNKKLLVLCHNMPAVTPTLHIQRKH